MLAGVFRDSRLGIPALGLLVVGFCADFAVNGRKDMYCFLPPADNWAYHVGQVAFLAMVAGGASPLWGCAGTGRTTLRSSRSPVGSRWCSLTHSAWGVGECGRGGRLG